MLRISVKRVTMTEKITRFGVSISPELLKKFDKMIKKEGYENRSEAIRDLIISNPIVRIPPRAQACSRRLPSGWHLAR